MPRHHRLPNIGKLALQWWQILFLVSFEACILFSGIAGFVVRRGTAGLLYHPLFQISAIQRASQDRFFFVFEKQDEA